MIGRCCRDDFIHTACNVNSSHQCRLQVHIFIDERDLEVNGSVFLIFGYNGWFSAILMELFYVEFKYRCRHVLK